MAGHILFGISIAAASKRRYTARDLVSLQLKQDLIIESIQLQYSYCCFRTSHELVTCLSYTWFSDPATPV